MSPVSCVSLKFQIICGNYFDVSVLSAEGSVYLDCHCQLMSYYQWCQNFRCKQVVGQVHKKGLVSQLMVEFN